MTVAHMSAKGVNGQLEILEGRIRISRKGVLGFLTQGLKGDKEINISSISSVQWKKAGAFTNGYIQFAFYGGAEAKGGLFQATQDENSIMFTTKQEAAFQAIRDEIQRRISAPATSAPTSSSRRDPEARRAARSRHPDLGGIRRQEEADPGLVRHAAQQRHPADGAAHRR